jgi:uncharacterized protein YlxP (DUF503 family)
MVVGTARVVIHIAGAQSLKDKRQVMKSLLAQVRREYQVAAAEVERQDQWQVGVIGLACVSTSAAHADEVIARAVHFIDSRHAGADMLEYETETIHVH